MTAKQWHLESGRISDIVDSKVRFDALVELHGRYYYELEFQRSKIRDRLHASLREKAEPFIFQPSS